MVIIIDMIEPVIADEKVMVFTDDHYYISQDCSHLTKNGAKYYAEKLDLGKFFYEETDNHP